MNPNAVFMALGLGAFCLGLCLAFHLPLWIALLIVGAYMIWAAI